MSLTSALRIAQNSLMNTGIQTTVTSRNISEASNPNYVRRDAVLVSTGNGARVVNINRATSDDLLWDSLQALSDSKAQSIVSNGANRLQRLVNGADNSTSAATSSANLRMRLQLYGRSLQYAACSAVGYAKEVADGLNSASLAIQEYRAELDQNINSVGELNNLLDPSSRPTTRSCRAPVRGRTSTTRSTSATRCSRRSRNTSPFPSFSAITTTSRSTPIQGVTLFETVPRG
jgi:flagellar hook-associated protein 1 FlgK